MSPTSRQPALDDLTPRIQDAWARGARAYDHDAGHGLITPAIDATWKRALGETLGPEPLDLLDVGAGTGFLTVMAAQLGHRPTGLDLTPAMLEGARRRAAAAQVRVTWREGDAMALPFPDASFDAVVSRHLLWTMPDPTQALQEWIRVVKPGGHVLWFDAVTPGPAWLSAARRRAAGLLRRLQRAPDRSAAHRYDEEMYARLPLYDLPNWRPVRDLLLDIGVEKPQFRLLPALNRAERAGWPRHRRLGATGRRYVGSFTVTAALHGRRGPRS